MWLKIKNKYIWNEELECVEICLCDKKQNYIISTLIDWEDYDKVKKYKWNLWDGRVNTRIKSKIVRLHRLLLNCPKGLEIDHIDHNQLDNRKSNLRICNKSQNQMNRKNVSGVCSYNKTNRWRAHIMVNQKQIHLGIFDSRKEALKVRHKAEKKYFGEFAYSCN